MMIPSSWVLAVMLAAQPQKTPWMDTYPRTAAEIASASNESPLFDGELGPAKTAAVMVAVAVMESALRPDAVGDSETSFCLFQINRTNFGQLGVTREGMLGDAGTCTRAALRMMHDSFRACKRLPVLHRLAWFASGGETCGGIKASERRVGLGMRLFEQHPPPSLWEAATASHEKTR